MVSLRHASALFLALSPVASAQWPDESLIALPEGAWGVQLRVADLDGDQDQDLVMFSRVTGALDWFENDGSGGWIRHSIDSLGAFAAHFDLVDVNDDGRQDIVASRFVTSLGADELLWLENPGAGSVWTSHGVPTGFTMIVKDLTVLDMDGDGLDDLLLSANDSLGYTNHLALRNTGATLEPTVNVAVHSSLTSASAADIDGDGKKDLLFVRQNFPFPSWRRNQSVPGTISWGSGGSLPDCQEALALDLDSDGDQDLLCRVSGLGPDLFLSENLGGVMGPLQSAPGLPTQDIPAGPMERADLDGDGDEDVLVGIPLGGVRALHVLGNQANGSFATALQVTPGPTFDAPLDHDFADLDGDGDLDVVVAWQDYDGVDSIRVFWNERTFGDDVLCMTQPNSTGAVAELSVTGSGHVAVNGTHLVASGLPASSFTMFVVGTQTIAGTIPPGSSGTLCLGGTLGRYVGPGQLLTSDATGTVVLPIDLTSTPLANHPTVSAGQTLHFQAWFRDVVGGAATSHFTLARSVTFQ